MGVMQLLTGRSQEPNVTIEGCDPLIRRACELGGLRIWQYKQGHDFDVTIRFVRRTGSEVEAKGHNTQLAFALKDAIDEAIALGAGN